jgi:hypothetical protein
MLTPAANTVLSGATVTFTWSTASGAAAYWLDVGSALGQGNIFGQNVGLATSQTVNGMPVDGSTVYVRLWTMLGGIWQFSDYTYQAGSTTAKAVMSIPAPATILGGASVTFTWSPATGATAYWLDVGSAQGQPNIFGQNVALATSQTVNGMPLDGSTVYVRLWTQLGGNWLFNEYTYQAAGGISKGAITSPAPGSALSGASATFVWSAGSGATTAYALLVGTAPGLGNIFVKNIPTGTSQTVNGLPVDGSTVYVKLWTGSGGVWQFNDYTYKASGGTPAVLTSPVPTSTLTGSSVTFTWNAGTGATAYWLDVGSTSGGLDLYSQRTNSTSLTVNGLPSGGITIYVRLWTAFQSQWQFTEFTYKAAP